MESTKSEETQTIRMAVFNDQDVDMVFRRLLELPSQILKVKKDIVEFEVKLKYDTTVKEAKDAITAVEIEVAFEVTNDMWSQHDFLEHRCIEKAVGKYRFTNDTQRKNEASRRLVANAEWIEARNQLGIICRARYIIEIDLGKAHASLGAVEAENHNLQRIAGMIEGLAHESTTHTTHSLGHHQTLQIALAELKPITSEFCKKENIKYSDILRYSIRLLPTQVVY